MPHSVIAIGGRQSIARIVLACAALLAPGAATATVEAACTISATAVNFGAYDVYAASPDDSVGSITYQCGTADRNITITLSTGGSGTYAARQMQPSSGSDRLVYNLYTDAARTAVWGNGSGGTNDYHIGKPPSNTNVSLSVYGRIPASQDVAIGNYSDTVIVTINF